MDFRDLPDKVEGLYGSWDFEARLGWGGGGVYVLFYPGSNPNPKYDSGSPYISAYIDADLEEKIDYEASQEEIYEALAKDNNTKIGKISISSNINAFFKIKGKKYTTKTKLRTLMSIPGAKTTYCAIAEYSGITISIGNIRIYAWDNCLLPASKKYIINRLRKAMNKGKYEVTVSPSEVKTDAIPDEIYFFRNY